MARDILSFIVFCLIVLSVTVAREGREAQHNGETIRAPQPRVFSSRRRRRRRPAAAALIVIMVITWHAIRYVLCSFFCLSVSRQGPLPPCSFLHVSLSSSFESILPVPAPYCMHIPRAPALPHWCALWLLTTLSPLAPRLSVFRSCGGFHIDLDYSTRKHAYCDGDIQLPPTSTANTRCLGNI